MHHARHQRPGGERVRRVSPGSRRHTPGMTTGENAVGNSPRRCIMPQVSKKTLGGRRRVGGTNARERDEWSTRLADGDVMVESGCRLGAQSADQGGVASSSLLVAMMELQSGQVTNLGSSLGVTAHVFVFPACTQRTTMRRRRYPLPTLASPAPIDGCSDARRFPLAAHTRTPA